MFDTIVNDLSSTQLALHEARVLLNRISVYLTGAGEAPCEESSPTPRQDGLIPRIACSTADTTYAALSLLEALKAFAIQLGVPDVCPPSQTTSHHNTPSSSTSETPPQARLAR